jgi:hypothetical protein
MDRVTLEEVALLGTSRRRLDESELPESLRALVTTLRSDDEAVRLLDVAAVATLYRRAGLRAGPAKPPPPPAPPDDGRPVLPAAARRLEAMLAGHDRRLLPLWLRTAAERNLRPPAETLPDLLELALRTKDLRADVLAAGGARLAWLAGQRDRWARLARSEPEPLPPDAWTTGRPEQRLALLAAARAADPAAARDRLAAGWARERPADRARLLAVLSAGLSPADEPFLAGCLDDPVPEVHREATALLLRLPGSAHADRARRHARDVVRVTGSITARSITARPQDDPGRAVAWAPLDTWVPAFGPTPEAVVALAVEPTVAAALWLGWARATRRERDAAWAAALLPRTPPDTDPQPVSGLVELLPPADRAATVTRLVGTVHPSVASVVPGPWPDGLVRAVLGWVAVHADSWGDVREVLGLAVDRVPFGAADAVAALGYPLPLHSPMRRRYAEAAAAVVRRREILEELQ